MYTDINDYLREFYAGIEDELLFRDGGRAAWDLYFHAAEVHAANQVRYGQLLFSGKQDEGFSFDPLLFLPCCRRDRGDPMPAEYVKRLRVQLSKEERKLDRASYLFFVGLSLHYAAPEDLVREIFLQAFPDYDVYEDSRDMYYAVRCIRKHLKRLFPDLEEEFNENIVSFMSLYTYILDVYKGMARKADAFHRGMYLSFSSFETFLFQIRVFDPDKERRKMGSAFVEEFHDGDNTGIYLNRLFSSAPDEKDNGLLMKEAYELTCLDMDRLHEAFIYELFSADEKMKGYMREHKKEIFEFFFYEKRKNENRIMELCFSGQQEVKISRKEILSLFVCLYPESLDRTHDLMDENKERQIEKMLENDECILSAEALLELLSLSKRERTRRKTQTRWLYRYCVGYELYN